MIIGIVIVTILYLILIGSFVFGFDRVNDFKMADVAPKHKFSIVVPFRNESEHLSEILKSLATLNYPFQLFEIIFVNDDSTDNSGNIINAFKNNNEGLNIRIISNDRMSSSPKKDAINTAVLEAKNEWIITTDADCIVPIYWLDTVDYFIQKNDCNLIVAPVNYHLADSIIGRFQHVDFLSLQGVTIGGFGIRMPILCNGANLIYKRSFFNALNPYKDNLNIASGDDMFLLEKALKVSPESVMYLKNPKAIVLTKPQPNLKSLIAQRVRWAAKTKSYNSILPKLIGMLVFTMNALLIALLVLTLLKSTPFSLFIYIFTIKTGIDFLLIFKTSRFFDEANLLFTFIISSVIYPFFSVYVALISLFKGFKWKDRAFSK